MLGYPDKAKDLTRQASDTYAAADHDQGLSQGQLSSITGAVQLASGQLETAAATLTSLLRQPATATSRTVAVDLTRLATIYIKIGEIDRGLTTGRHALNAVAAVPGSIRLTHRLTLLQRVAASVRKPNCQDFAKVVHAHLQSAHRSESGPTRR